MNNTEQTPNERRGWAAVEITPDMPLTLMVNFLNALNRRLVTIEDNTYISLDDGTTISLTEYYSNLNTEE